MTVASSALEQKEMQAVISGWKLAPYPLSFSHFPLLLTTATRGSKILEGEQKAKSSGLLRPARQLIALRPFEDFHGFSVSPR
jgi:hypothetical protein